MKGYVIEMGHLVTHDGVTHTEYPYAILIEFDTTEEQQP